MRPYIVFFCTWALIIASCVHSKPSNQATDASQIISEVPSLPDTPSPFPKTPTTQDVAQEKQSACPINMVEIKGTFCPGLKETCAEWMAPGDHFRCKRFAKSQCKNPTVEKHFCVDRYEYPNTVGVMPKVLASWFEANALCAQQNKRLCRAQEWTFACQGQKWNPYPYGTVRDSTACRIDLGHLSQNWQKGRENGLQTAPAPIKGQVTVNHSKPSGEYPRCVSDFGVHDLTGNVDEWVTADNDTGNNPNGWLKGGWWGNVRNRCGEEATTTEHGKDYTGIQTGFRCCADPKK